MKGFVILLAPLQVRAEYAQAEPLLQKGLAFVETARDMMKEGALSKQMFPPCRGKLLETGSS